MVNDNELRQLLARAAGAVPADPGLPARARAGGTGIRRRYRQRLQTLGAVASAAALVAGFLVVDPLGLRGPRLGVAAVITCAPGRTAVGADVVEASQQGLPLEINNVTRDPLLVAVGGFEVAAPPGRTSTQLPLPPGTVRVSCDGVSAAQVTLTDPNAVYAHPQRHCPLQSLARPQETLAAGDLPAVTVAELTAVVGSDARPVSMGYPRGAIRQIGVQRYGQLVAVATWHEIAEPGAWLLGAISVCEGTGPAQS